MSRAPEAGLLVADATALPFPDAAADLAGQLRVPNPEPVAAYVRSMRETARLPDARPLVEAVTSRLRAAHGDVFQVTTHSGCLVCA